MTQEKTTLSREQRFVARLEELDRDQDRAALASLRRCLGKTPWEAAEAHRYVLPFQPQVWEEGAYYLVGALFALHPNSWHADKETSTNLGASFAALRAQADSDSLERRFVALLNCHEDDLNQHLRHAVSLLKSKDIAVDWVQLLRDLPYWNHENRSVQRRWARAFWGHSTEIVPDNTPASTLEEK